MTIDLIKLVEDSHRLRDNTKRNYLAAVRQWLEYAGADPVGWTPVKCQAFYDHLIVERKLSKDSANVMISSALAYVFRRANALYGIPNVVAAVDKYKPTRDSEKRRRSLSEDQAMSLLAVCDGSALADLRDRAILIIGFFTGMRRTSLVSIELESVDVWDGYVTLRAKMKGGDWYNVPLSAYAWDRTHAYRKAMTTARGQLNGPLFPSLPRTRETPGSSQQTIGSALSEDGLYRALKLRAASAGVKFHPHLLRHTFVTWCRAAKIEDYLIEIVTGHSTHRGLVSTVYTDKPVLYADVARRCYDAVAAKLGV